MVASRGNRKCESGWANTWGGAGDDAAANIAVDDLPTTAQNPPAGGAIVLEDGTGNDEGRAMLQIVHDVAPGATLLFHAAATANEIEEAILDLADPRQGNADVIVDDLSYRYAPMFMDGPIAQAVDEAVDSGVSYFTSAGNYANRSYISAFDDSGSDLIRNLVFYGRPHDFDPDPNVVEIYQEVALNPNDRISLCLQ